MAPDVGYFAPLLALFISLTQSATPFIAMRRDDPTIAAFADRAALGQLIFILVSFACLTFSFMSSDFSVALVAANSHTAKPLLYKISGVWGNHEGSMLLWVVIMPWVWIGALVMAFGGVVSLSDRRLRVGVPQRIQYRAAELTV
jgi:cytochrome c-type biogenesis protein CcmF